MDVQGESVLQYTANNQTALPQFITHLLEHQPDRVVAFCSLSLASVEHDTQTVCTYDTLCQAKRRNFVYLTDT